MTNLSIQSVGGLLLLFLVYFVEVGSQSSVICPHCKIYIEHPEYFGLYEADYHTLLDLLPVLRRVNDSRVLIPDADYPNYMLVYDPILEVLKIMLNNEEIFLIGIKFYPCARCNDDFTFEFSGGVLFRRDNGLDCVPQPDSYLMFTNSEKIMYLGPGSKFYDCVDLVDAIDFETVGFDVLIQNGSSCFAARGSFTVRDPESQVDPGDNYSCPLTTVDTRLINRGCKIHVSHLSLFGQWEIDLGLLEDGYVVLRRRNMETDEAGFVTLQDGFNEGYTLHFTAWHGGRVRMEFNETSAAETWSVVMKKHICIGVQTNAVYEILSSDGSTSGHLVRKDEGSCIAIPGKWEMNSDVYKGDVEIGTSLPSIFHCIAAAEQNMRFVKFNGIVHDGEQNQCQGYAGNFDSSNFRENTDVSTMSHTTCVKAIEVQYGIFPECQVCITQLTTEGEQIRGLYAVDLNTVHGSTPILRRRRMSGEKICSSESYDDISMRWDWEEAGHVFFEGEMKLLNSPVLEMPKHVCNGIRENWTLIDISETVREAVEDVESETVISRSKRSTSKRNKDKRNKDKRNKDKRNKDKRNKDKSSRSERSTKDLRENEKRRRRKLSTIATVARLERTDGEGMCFELDDQC